MSNVETQPLLFGFVQAEHSSSLGCGIKDLSVGGYGHGRYGFCREPVIYRGPARAFVSGDVYTALMIGSIDDLRIRGIDHHIPDRRPRDGIIGATDLEGFFYKRDSWRSFLSL